MSKVKGLTNFGRKWTKGVEGLENWTIITLKCNFAVLEKCVKYRYKIFSLIFINDYICLSTWQKLPKRHVMSMITSKNY